MTENEVKNISIHSKDRDTAPRWYIIHTYSGHENKVKLSIEKMVENRGMQDVIMEIKIPTEDVIEIKNGERKLKTVKKFPGYVFVKMIVTDDAWYLVRNAQGVTGFLGNGSDPIALSDEEVQGMNLEKINIEMDISIGETIRVISGPFESFMGTIEEINIEKQTIKAKVSMFGRETPVELEFSQVSKLN